ncbi:hypothetical protein [Clostridium beijerinckii]|uniref:hypothetical protein n=1 Tax=Clostridium beijerinckii TaxID=1520 RepID=UPI001F16C338|nr:hypothetical protein [Clostridium beijerinckii]
MDITKFNEKLNRISGNVYTMEEEVIPVSGVYEASLIHDNVTTSTINVYTGSKLTGDKINTISFSTPSLTPWKTIIKIFSNEPKLYISYEATGDQVEAEDINNLQDAVVETQESLNNEINRATNAEKVLTDNLNTEISRAKSSENMLTNNLNSEITRAKGAENTLTNNLTNEVNRATTAENTLNNNLNSEVNRAKLAEGTLTVNINSEVTRATSAESTLTNNLNSEITRAKAAENTLTNTINTNKPNWDDKYSRNEVDNKISQVVSNMDWKESVATYADIATTYSTPDDGWTVNVKDTDITYRYSGSAWIPISANSIPLASSSVDGKMSKQDKIDHDDMNSKKHIHSNKGIIDIITQGLIDNWNAAYTHISDTVKHITAAERTLWNSVNNKSDVGHTHIAVNITDLISTIRSCVLAGLSTTTNSIISASDTVLGALGKLQSQITANLSTLTSHTSNTNNPHSTTASQIGLGNVTNDSQVKRSEMGVANGVATLDSSGVNNQAPKPHTHDDRYYTESEANAKFATKDEISTAGYGDMLKSVYDTNNNGVVDRAEKLSTARKINGVNFDGGGDITIYDNTKLPLTGGTVTGRTLFNQGISIININGGAGTAGFMYFAQIKVNSSYQNQPIVFCIHQRERFGTIIIKFNSQNTSDPTLSYINKIGNINAYIYKSATSTWDLYIQKSEGYDSIDIVGFSKGDYMNSTSVTWQSSTVTSLPTGYTEASIATIDIISTRANQDSDGKQINSTYVKKGMTWNDLEGV